MSALHKDSQNANSHWQSDRLTEVRLQAFAQLPASQ